jgi:hypothetical protein
MIPAARGSRRRYFLALLLSATLTGGATAASAQSATDRAWYARFVDGVAALTYNIAWPTATYRDVEVSTVTPAEGGADVAFRLHGKSAFADGDLWLDVIMHVRDGRVAGLDWGENNGFFPPGLTTSAVLEGLNSAMKQANAPSAGDAAPASTPAVAVACVTNTTNGDVPFTLQRGADTSSFKLGPGQAMIFSAGPSDRHFQITFDNSYADGYQAGSLSFNAAVRSPRPESCDDDLTFVFLASGDRLGLMTKTWIPGFPSPWDDAVLQSDVKDQWVCAGGFRPYPWDTGQGLQCIGTNAGVVGLTLVKDETSPFIRIDRVFASSPAAQAGLERGMMVISIDGASTDKLDVAGAISKLTGGIGSTVDLGVISAGATPTIVTLTRR